ncbi:receptor-like protein eix2 [Quercus suber]|uniref:Receptor-like protein eix2 n=1 Tax=Quercus suber TaxID=58331 RepID=A0AAW0L7M8_QUESU
MGKLPHQLAYPYVSFIDLSYNRFKVLSYNNFYGEIPSSSQNYSLINTDLGENHFLGNLPSWIGSDFYVIRLWLNLFVGIIPRQWCNLSVLHILDLAQNNIFGGILDCIDNLTTLTYSNNTIGYFGYQSYFEKN